MLEINVAIHTSNYKTGKKFLKKNVAKKKIENMNYIP